ncbi:CDP-glucose 4,6-dehydratase [Pigmentibacter ruber]|uniref:CDP-glucose 4,6-dehydratase n=1 Tax=Pigmentibacter ruber TaxID=2683196 RepID=UPI00131D25DF|nr:CDP-glucose 4,6-dehydratase [Pigmentibacter ruber]BFD31232.1 CDP-glucose 4,6-dehydratase [Pigmentibacter ruber]
MQLEAPFQNIYKNKKVFITGHTGFKGSWLTQWLLNLGAEVAGYSLYIPSEPSLYEILDLNSKIKNYKDDIRNFDSLLHTIKEFNPDIIFHLAAQPIVMQSYLDPKNNFDVNVMGMVNILEAIRVCKSIQAAVLITSDKCYENVEWEYGYRETDRLGGKDPYSASKACAEIVFSSYARSFFQDHETYLATARAGNVIGGGDWAADRIIPDAMRAWSKGLSLKIRNPHATRPWQHVLEPLSGYLMLGAKLLTKTSHLHGESFNFGPPQEANHSVEYLLNILEEKWKSLPTKIENKNNTLGEASLLKLCCDKALNRLKWKPNLSFEETLVFTNDWYLNYYNNQETDYTKQTIKQIEEYTRLALQRNLTWAI